MYKLYLLLFVATTLALPQQGEKTLDDMLEDIFGPKELTTGSPSSPRDNMEAELDKIFGSDPSSSSIKIQDVAKTGEECIMNKRRGICVPYYQCDKEDSEGIDIVDGRAIYCESYVEVCCHRVSAAAPKS